MPVYRKNVLTKEETLDKLIQFRKLQDELCISMDITNQCKNACCNYCPLDFEEQTDAFIEELKEELLKSY